MEESTSIIGEFSLNTFHTGTVLHTAAVNGDKLTIERLLRQQEAGEIETLNEGDKYGRTALVYTVFGEWYECAEILVRHRASVLQVDCDKRSVLHWAAYLDRPKFIKLFLEHVGSNVDWNSGDKDCRTPLHYAAMQPNSKCLRLLLKRLLLLKERERERLLNSRDNEQMNALHWSVFYNRLENFKLLIQAVACTIRRDANGRCLLHLAVLNPSADSVRIVRLLLKMNQHYSRMVDLDKRTALHLAVANGNEEIVRELCMAEESALNDTDNFSRSVLHYAVLKNDLRLVNILISAGVKSYHVDNTGASVLHYAAKHNSVHILNRLLLFCEDSTDNQGRTALMWAASEGCSDVLSVMLRHLSYFNIHASDEQGLTALHFACFAGHEKCVRLLIANSADISQPDKLGQTALFKACQQGHRKIIDILTNNTENQWIMCDDKDHAGTSMDNERLQVGARKGMLIDNTKHLFSIKEESAVTSDTLKNSQWTHELTELTETSSLVGVEIIRNSPRRENGSFLGACTSEDPNCDGQTHKKEISDGEPMKDVESPHSLSQKMQKSQITNTRDNQGEYSELHASLKAGIKHPGGNSSWESLTESTRLGIHDLRDDNGCTPLHFAAHAGHTPVCRWLISQGVDPGKKDVQGRTALHGAAFNGHTECMALMLSGHPELVNDRDTDGYSVLHHAAISGQLEAVKLLVSDPHADLNYRVKSTDWTPLDFAMAAEHQDVTQFLMDNGALTIAWLQDLAADTIKRFLRRLVIQRREANVKSLIERHKKLTKEEGLKHRENENKTTDFTKDDVTKDDVTKYDVTKADFAKDDIMKVDIKDDVTQDDVARDDVTKIDIKDDVTNNDVTLDEITKNDVTKNGVIDNNRAVCRHGNDDVIDIIDTKETSNVMNSAQNEDNCTQTTVDKDKLRTVMGNNNLRDPKPDDHRAAADDDQLRTFADLFGKSVFSACDNTNEVSLLDACYHGNLERVQKLLEKDIDVGYRDENGSTALHIAAASGYDTVIGHLLDFGAVTHMRDTNGLTPLHHAAIVGNSNSISLLLRHNKELISYLDCDDKSALHYAASMGHLEVVKILSCKHSWVQDFRAKSTQLTALDCAILGHHDDVVEFMTSQGAQRSGLLDQATRIIQRNFRECCQISCKAIADEKTIKNTENNLVKNERRLEDDQKRMAPCSKEDFKEIITSTSETNHIFTHSPITRKSSSETYNPEIHSKNPRTESINPQFAQLKLNSTVDASLTFAQSNIENLSRAPDCVVVASGEKERIFELRKNWERIALLRRKKQAALVIQGYFRKYKKSGDSVDTKNTAKEYGTELRREKEDSHKLSDKSSMTENHHIYINSSAEHNQIRLSTTMTSKDWVNTRKEISTDFEKGKFTSSKQSATGSHENSHNSTAKLQRNQIRFSMPIESFSAHKTTNSYERKDDHFSKSNKNSSSSGVSSHEASPPKRLTRKGVVNRLRAESPEHSSSENEPMREKLPRYKSTFPLLSPKTSSTSSPSIVSVNQLPKNRRVKSSPSNRRVDVAPTLPKNELISQWLTDGLVSGNSSQECDWNTQDKNQAAQDEKSHARLFNRKMDTSKRGARRMSSQSARIRRESQVKNTYGSPAALSYNFALDTYHPLASRRGCKEAPFPFKTSGRVRPNSMKRIEGRWVQTTDVGFTPSESCNNTC